MENIELAQERKRSEVPLVTVGSDIFINADPSDPKRVNGVHV
jgi:prefoldin subunit 5